MNTQTPAPQATTSTGFDDHVAALDEMARRIEAGEPGVEAELALRLDALRADSDPRSVGLYVFGAGLARRLSPQAVEQANLYLNRFEVPQIHLFNLLGRAVPFVGLATQLANEAIAQALQGELSPTVIDVGIGTGRQVCVLLDTLAQRGTLPVALTVIGIEPSDWALEEARHNIEATAERLGADVSFFGVVGTAEGLSAADWRRIRQACTSQPVINASFALHHIADDPAGNDQRNAVLQQLQALSPALLVLSEPDVDHREPGLHQRFRNCMAHFGAVFRTLDRLPLAQADRDALKVGFFGREIADILGGCEDQRSERHESAASWLQRLEACGFKPRDSAALPALDNMSSAAVRVARRAHHLSIDAIDEPVVAIITAVPVAASAPRATPASAAAELASA